MSTSGSHNTADRLRWKEIGRKTVFKSLMFEMVSSEQQSADGKLGTFTLMECADWANVVALTKDAEGRDALLLVRQFRIGGAELALEFPGGALDQGEEPLAGAKRELFEETGYTADSWVKLGDINPNPAFMTNRIFSFLATGLRRAGEQELDDFENIDVHIVPLSELDEGRHPEFLVNGVMLISWHWFNVWRKAN